MKQSLKFNFITRNLKKLISPLKLNQNFLRLIYYMSNSPLSDMSYDSNGLDIPQPDIVVTNSGKLIEDKKIVLTLFNQTVLSEEEVTIFFSHIDSKFYDTKTPLSDTIYQMDIIVPYKKITLNTGEARQELLASYVCQAIDQQNIAGMGTVYCIRGGQYKVDDTYQGFSLVFKVNDSTKVVK